jgi:hypothetical protein
MAKMLMLDGPLAGQFRDVTPGRMVPVPVPDPSGVAEHGEYRLVTYVPHEYMFGARMIIVGICGSPDRRALEELAFAALASDAAKQAAGPMARYVCDHQAYDTRCPRGCHGDRL